VDKSSYSLADDRNERQTIVSVKVVEAIRHQAIDRTLWMASSCNAVTIEL